MDFGGDEKVRRYLLLLLLLLEREILSFHLEI